ncbi:MAG TPA: GWxTD domain-containing protein [Thermoanaerobaculia bacterium]|nr:GWxTD domain-containing protein [Thermoanaerobaculia bacterium]
MHRIAAALVTLLLTSPAFAALSPELTAFVTGPAKHLMTRAETRQWKAIKTDEGAEAFIAFFWAKRDPTIDTRRNEAKEAFDERVAFADENFSNERVRGALTDRGRVLILLGHPTSFADIVENLGTTGVNDQSRPAGRIQRWLYRKADLPSFFNRPEVEIEFFDPSRKNDYGMNVGITAGGGLTQRALVIDLLDRAREQSVISASMTAPPTYPDEAEALFAPFVSKPVEEAPPEPVDTSLRSEALRAAIDEARKGSSSIAQPALTWRQFESEGDKVRVPLLVSLPPAFGLEAGADVTAFGAVVNGSGDVVASFEESVVLNDSRGDLYIDRLLVLDPGQYVAFAGVAQSERAIALGRTKMTVERPGATTSVSSLILSNNVFELTSLDPNQAFALSGMKAVPKADRRFRKNHDLWYVLVIRNPAVDGEGLPKIRARLITKSGGEARSTPEKKVAAYPLNDSENDYWIGSSIPLSSFASGDYRVVVIVTDAIANKSYEVEDHFTIE